jgi:hypothetical protein
MRITRSQLRRLIQEQIEEERSELDKIKEIFISNGTQAVELGKMLLPDSPEVKAMEASLKRLRAFFKLFENPNRDRLRRMASTDNFYSEMNRLLYHAIPGYSPLESYPHRMYREVGTMYKNMEGIIGFKKLDNWLATIQAAAEWAGLPVPVIPEEPFKR